MYNNDLTEYQTEYIKQWHKKTCQKTKEEKDMINNSMILTITNHMNIQALQKELNYVNRIMGLTLRLSEEDGGRYIYSCSYEDSVGCDYRRIISDIED